MMAPPSRLALQAALSAACLFTYAVLWPGRSAVGAEALVLQDAGPPFGELPLIEEVRCGDPADGHPFAESEPGASRVETILGRPCRVLPNGPGGGAKYFAYRIGEGWDLQPGAAYVLQVEYPEDEPRAMFLLNRGCETARGLRTGACIGDVAVGYTDSVLESLQIPLSGRHEQWSMLFFLHDRFPGLELPRGKGARPHLPEEGFWVIVAQLPHKQAPRSAGAAVSRIRLFLVPDYERLCLPLRLPPKELPRRHIFWREEMSDGVIDSRDPAERGVTEDVDWYEYKARLMKFLGVNTFCKDLLEFGHNQGWDSAVYGGNDWVNQTAFPDRWSRILDMVAGYGLDVLPYYEYAGSVGGPLALGSQKRCMTLQGTQNYTNISWCELAHADVTDPDTLADAVKVLDATITRHKGRARFLGAWLRTRPGHLPISFSDRCLELFARETGRPEAPAREGLAGDEALRADYYDWWFGKRREFLLALRDHLRREVNEDAVILFTPDASEPGPPLIHNHRTVVTDDFDWWKPALWDLWGWQITPRDYATILAEGGYAEAVRRPPTDWQQWEFRHATPEADPERYAHTDGVLLTYPFSSAYTVSLPGPMEAFRAPAGMAMVRHFSLNENTMEGKLGYFVADMDRPGPYCMLSEARAVAYGDPRYLGYLSAAGFNRGSPEHVRRFNAAFLALPALPSKVASNASDDPDVVVRAIDAGAYGTYLAVVNVGLQAAPDVAVRLPAEGAVTDAATGAALAPVDGSVTLSLGPCELRSLHVAAPD